MISGFYMALILTTRYRGHIKEFYWNRFLRLYPIYWMLAAALATLIVLYWVTTGRTLSVAYTLTHRPPNGPMDWLWMAFSNVAIFGSDLRLLYENLRSHGTSTNTLLVLPQAWSLGTEVLFYLAAPLALRLRVRTQVGLFAAALASCRLLASGLAGWHWTIWTYYFAPATTVYFMGGVFAYHLMGALRERRAWFSAWGPVMGWGVTGGVVIVIAVYGWLPFLVFDDWRAFVAFGLALPFIFAASRSSRFDQALGAYSYPLYLTHSALATVYAPLWHLIPESAKIYAITVASLVAIIGPFSEWTGDCNPGSSDGSSPTRTCRIPPFQPALRSRSARTNLIQKALPRDANAVRPPSPCPKALPEGCRR